MAEELPEQLLDVHAICDQRDHFRERMQAAEELLRTAPIHHHGKGYELWRDRRDAYFTNSGEGKQ